MKLAAALQYLLPHHLLSHLARCATRWRWRPWKDRLIHTAIRRFGVDMSEAAQPDPTAYPHFNAFFTRALRDGARTPDPDPRALLMPADGRISQRGRIQAGHLLQAKAHTFTAGELLGDAAAAAPFADGWFVTVYLSPRDYHRVHMPCAGRLRETVHIPGRIFSVAPFAVQTIPRLFARNERLVCHFDCDFGPMTVVMVGAIFVSGVETVWNGEQIPPYASQPIHRDWRDSGIVLDRFAEMARFNYGSTVIVLLPKNGIALDSTLMPEQVTRIGQRLALYDRPSAAR